MGTLGIIWGCSEDISHFLQNYCKMDLDEARHKVWLLLQESLNLAAG